MGDALPYVNLGTGRTAKAIFAGPGKTCVIDDLGGVGVAQLERSRVAHRADLG